MKLALPESRRRPQRNEKPSAAAHPERRMKNTAKYAKSEATSANRFNLALVRSHRPQSWSRSGSPGAPRPRCDRDVRQACRLRGARRGRRAPPRPPRGGSATPNCSKLASASRNAASASSSRSCSSSARPSTSCTLPNSSQVLLAALQELRGDARLLLGLLDTAGAEMDLGERGDGERGFRLVAAVESDAERLLEQLHGLVGVAEQEVERPEVVRQLRDVGAVGRARRRPGAPSRRSCGRASSGPRGRRSATPGSTPPRPCASPRRRCASSSARLDVLAGGVVVARVPPAARPPREDVRAERVARHPRALGKRERLVQKSPSAVWIAVELEPAAAEDVAAPRRARHRRSLPTPRARGPRSSRLEGATRLADAHLREPAVPSERAVAAAPGLPVARDGRRASLELGHGLLVALAPNSASARASAPSSRPRSSVATPFARKPASTPSRSASHSIVSRVGRVLPRSIWETYSFEKRSPASVALGQARPDAQLAQAIPEPGRTCAGLATACGWKRSASTYVVRSHAK